MQAPKDRSIFASDKVELITNFEVMERLVEYESKNSQNFNKTTSSTLLYLKSTPCSLENSQRMKRYVDIFEKYQLSQIEVIQMLNFLPKTEVELHLYIDNCSNRFSEEEREEILTSIAKIQDESANYDEEEKDEEEKDDQKDEHGETTDEN